MIRDTICILTLCFAVLFVGVVTAEESPTPPAEQRPQTPGVLRVQAQPDQIVEVRTKTRHTTVLVLPQGENILDFVVGDSDYWHLSGSANLAYLKPLDEKVRTNVALVCESGTIYSFLVKEAPDPHLVVRIEAGEAPPPPAGQPLSPGRRSKTTGKWPAPPARPHGRPEQRPIFDPAKLSPVLVKLSTNLRSTTLAGCPSPTSSTRRPTSGLSWLTPCGMTANSPISGAVRRSLPRSTS